MSTTTRVKTLRKTALELVEQHVAGAISELDRAGCRTLSQPPADHRTTGEWDWYFHGLRPAERARLQRRWISPYGSGPDVVAHELDTDVDEAMHRFVSATRVIDAELMLRAADRNGGYRSRLHASASLGGLSVDDVLPTSELSLCDLFARPPHCTEYLERLDAEMALREAEDEEVNPCTSDSSSLPPLPAF